MADLPQKVEEAAAACGFEAAGVCSAASLTLRPEVREMCASGRCHAYGHNWACPPVCGSLDDFAQLIAGYDRCTVVQTVGQLEDEFDAESMMEAEQRHRARMMEAARMLEGEAALVLAAGTCMLCPECTCPDAPCRFPQRRLTSMEAAGVLVSEACEAAGIPYNHGPNTIAFTGCILWQSR